MELGPGVVVASRYRVEARVGQGAWGEVWVAEQLAVGMKVAIKTLRATSAGDAEAVARFRREAFFMARIRSDYVARLLDFLVDDTFGLVLVMEFIEGEPLTALVQERRLSVEEGIDLGAQLAAGVCDFHAVKVIHRDLKPANVIMRPMPEGRSRPIIVDFSLSRLDPTSSGASEESITDITKSNMALGTLPYMAPEQVLNSKQATEKSDVYSLGAILFRAVMGRHVFAEPDYEIAQTKLKADPPPMRTGRTDRIARSFEAVVDRAVRRIPADRYESARALYTDLNALRDLLRRGGVHDSEPGDPSTATMPGDPVSGGTQSSLDSIDRLLAAHPPGRRSPDALAPLPRVPADVASGPALAGPPSATVLPAAAPSTSTLDQTHVASAGLASPRGQQRGGHGIRFFAGAVLFGAGVVTGALLQQQRLTRSSLQASAEPEFPPQRVTGAVPVEAPPSSSVSASTSGSPLGLPGGESTSSVPNGLTGAPDSGVKSTDSTPRTSAPLVMGAGMRATGSADADGSGVGGGPDGHVPKERARDVEVGRDNAALSPWRDR